MSSFHVLLLNIGSPKSYHEEDVEHFLRSFLMDKYIMQIPWLIRKIVVNCFIVPRRKGRSSMLYSSIWGDDISPLIKYSRSLGEKLEQELKEGGHDIGVSVAMRHDDNEIEKTIQNLSKSGVKELLVIPLFPQFEASSYLSCTEEAKRALLSTNITAKFVEPFYSNQSYISLLKNSVADVLKDKNFDKLIFSYHSIPLDYLPCSFKVAKECCSSEECDPYRTQYCKGCYKYQCYATSKSVVDALGIPKNKYQIIFQSKMGHKEWITPLLSDTLAQLPSEGTKKIAVVAPSFISDCVETLHEIEIEGRDTFVSNGGDELFYIPALNDTKEWVKTLYEWVLSSKNKF